MTEAASRAAALCERCSSARPVLRRPKDGSRVCKTCFFACFEAEVHETIVRDRLLRRGETVAIGASGGKDSTVLAYVMKALNERYDYGVNLLLLSIDEGITGYRDDSLDCVKRHAEQYEMPLHILSYKDLYGWSMDDIVAEIGLRGNCTFCGVFRRQALDRGARALGVNKIATGHNADDMAETVLMNLLRGDIARLGRCASAITGAEGDMPRVKPFKGCHEKEIVLYAYHRRLTYFSTECIYSPNAYRGFAREFIKDVEAVRPSAVLDIIHSAEAWAWAPPAPAARAGAAAAAASDAPAAAAALAAADQAAPAEGALAAGGGCGRKVGSCGCSGTSSAATAGAAASNDGSCCNTTGGAGSCACKAAGTAAAESASALEPPAAAAAAAGAAPQQQPARDRRRGGGGGGKPAASSTSGAASSSSSSSGNGGSGAAVCVRCGYMTSSAGGLCQACNLLAGLEAGRPRLGLTTLGRGGGSGVGGTADAAGADGSGAADRGAASAAAPGRVVRFAVGGLEPPAGAAGPVSAAAALAAAGF